MARNKRALRLKQKRRRQQFAQSSVGKVSFASAWPLTSCLMSDNWNDLGALVQIIVTRTRRPDDSHSDCAVGVFLVDLGCLGIKNAFAKVVPPPERRQLVADICQSSMMVEVSPDLALKVIQEATVYAAELGFSPDPDAKAALLLLRDADPSAAHEQIHLGGPDGKPHYISGPHDDQEQICHQLESRLGPDGFNYTIQA